MYVSPAKKRTDYYEVLYWSSQSPSFFQSFITSYTFPIYMVLDTKCTLHIMESWHVPLLEPNLTMSSEFLAEVSILSGCLTEWLILWGLTIRHCLGQYVLTAIMDLLTITPPFVPIIYSHFQCIRHYYIWGYIVHLHLLRVFITHYKIVLNCSLARIDSYIVLWHCYMQYNIKHLVSIHS